jgi:glycyl-tRNA synthetase beta chain
MTEFLLEINTEEMPSSHVKAGLAQLRDKIAAELASRRIGVASLETFGTCRRLVIRGEFEARQADKEETVTGPPRTAAFGPDGAPTVAARGFARSQNVEVEKLRVIETPRGQYVGLNRTIPGLPATQILSEAMPGIITSLSFPKMMKWGESGLRFSRPIKNILCLFGGKTLGFAIDGLAATDRTSGHRLHAPRRFKVTRAAGETVFQAYERLLRERQVILDPEERKTSILAQVREKLEPLGAELYPDEELLEKLSYDIEWPHVILGGFPAEYLELPLEVLSMAMREGQKLFSVVRDGRQLPSFIGIADAAGDAKSLIRRGNERVLRARLEDARFFWQQDRKTPLAERAEGLKNVVFQERLGTYAHKAERLKELVAYLCETLGKGTLKEDAVLAAGLAKVDLITDMVREFPGLQGKMGGLYARAEGYSETACRAVYEHYLPLSFEGRAPETMAGAVLSLADKLDSIVGIIGVGEQVTGSSDQFGLRRSAHGVARIILDRGFSLSLGDLVEKAAARYMKDLGQSLEINKIKKACLSFFEQRLRYIFETQGFRYDLVNAALAAGPDNLFFCRLRLCALDAIQKNPEFNALILMAKRVNNILRDVAARPVDPELLTEPEEKELYSTLSKIGEEARPQIAAGAFAGAQSAILGLQGPLTVFFERVLVMAEDPRVRENRLALLQAVRALLLGVADYSRVVVEGERPA